MEPRIIAIVGKSNSGKTTLVEKLVAGLTQNGHRIGTVKHTHCGFELDREGKDSWRHKNAGAAATLLLKDGQAALIRDDHRAPVEKMIHYLSGMDLILAEGFKSQDLPKIEIFRKEAMHKIPLCLDQDFNVSDTLVAFVTDSAFKPDVPVFGLNDISGMIDFIQARFLGESFRDRNHG